MFLLIRFYIVFLVSLSFSAAALPAGTLDSESEDAMHPALKIASMEIPHAYEPNGKGVYNEIFAKLTEGYKGDLNVSFYPSARYNRVMTSRGADCDYIATDHLDRWKDHGITSNDLEFIGPVNTLFVILYIPVDAPDVTTIEQIKALTLASDINLLNVIHDHGIKEKFALQSQTQMLNLLAIGRISGLIGYDFDLDFLSKKMGVADKMKKATIRLSQLNDGIVCFKTERTAAFRAHLWKSLNNIKTSGWLENALKDY